WRPRRYPTLNAKSGGWTVAARNREESSTGARGIRIVSQGESGLFDKIGFIRKVAQADKGMWSAPVLRANASVSRRCEARQTGDPRGPGACEEIDMARSFGNQGRILVSMLGVGAALGISFGISLAQSPPAGFVVDPSAPPPIPMPLPAATAPTPA